MSKSLKNKFLDYEAEPERDVWAGVERALQAKPKGAILPLWGVRWAMAAGVALVMGVGIWNMLPQQVVPQPTETASTISTPTETHIPIPSVLNDEEKTQPPVPAQLVAQAAENPLPASNPRLKERTKVYVVKVTEQYDDQNPQAQPLITKVEKQEVAILPSPKLENNNSQPVVVESKTEIPQEKVEKEEWIVYEMPSKKKKELTTQAPAKQTLLPQNNRKEVLNLNKPSLDDIAAFSSQQLNKVVNMPISVNQKGQSTVYEVNLGGLRIQHKSAKKVEREY